jgi:serine/threonine-protein kinase PknK
MDNLIGELELHEVEDFAEGSSAWVLRARDARGRRVAIKVAKPDHEAHVLGEAEPSALGLSPALPRLLDLGSLERRGARAVLRRGGGGPTALVLSWVEGQRALAYAREGPREPRALQVVAGLADALAALHAAGLAHGDVKPENVLVGADGEVHLLDLGLVTERGAAEPRGGTPRYLGQGDRELGDARARDLLALGLTAAELADEAIAEAPDALAAARAGTLGGRGALGAIIAALVTQNPWARPAASWVVARTGRASRSLGPRLVRASYLRLRRAELSGAEAAAPDTAPALVEALELTRRVALAQGDGWTGGATLHRLSTNEMRRWLAALVGPPALAWPVGVLMAHGEREVFEALCRLAARLDPAVWSLGDVERALEDGAPPLEGLTRALDPDEASRLALALARVPPSRAAVARVEAALLEGERPPLALTEATLDALRRAGELGRAKSLGLFACEGLDPSLQGAPELLAGLAEVLRRGHDPALARTFAERARACEEPSGRPSATLARIALDEGRLDEARALVGERLTAPLCEVRALVHASLGDTARALAELERGEAVAEGDEQLARLAGARGFVVHERSPRASLEAHGRAAELAARAGAPEEEAAYRTGEAGAAAELGQSERAVATAQRASLLWEALGRPERAARALVAEATAHALVGEMLEARAAAEEARSRARAAGDARATLFAELTLAELAERGGREGQEAALAARDALPASPPVDDELRVGASLELHAPLAQSDVRRGELDALARGSTRAPGAALDWWGARAERLYQLDEPLARGADAVVGELAALCDVEAPLVSRGRALFAGYRLAARLGHGDRALRLLGSLGEVVRELRASTGGRLRATFADSLPRASEARPEQARELERLVVSLSERERLSALLTRVVDALVLWTGVERGLLLLRAPDGRLVARAARNLARADLEGEQMQLSQTIALRALESRELVLAVDAAGELPELHRSVHALKLRSVLALPLVARGEAVGVAYLDDRVRRGAFGEREVEWARTIAALAAVAIADTRDRVLLRRAARRAERATMALEAELAKREVALSAAEEALARGAGRGTRHAYDAIVGETPAIVTLLRTIDRVSQTDVPVLVVGESGSGKELVARALHEASPRRERPFVSENCGAIPEALLESTLFGHARGAFTGADRPRAGLFEIADRGTLFLDELGEMSLGMQTKLLRVLEDGLVRPLGSERARKVDVRVVAATHRDLAQMVRDKQFREDLYYRLAVIALRIPPLRERASDIPLLVRRMLTRHGAQKVQVTRLAMDALVAFSWPGNVRQLENELRRALVLSDGVIDETHLSPELRGLAGLAGADGARRHDEPEGLELRARLDALEVRLVKEALSRTRGNQTQAAKLLGVSRFGLQKMMKRLAITVEARPPLVGEGPR